MKIVGIMGNSGSGKTTLSNFLLQKKNTGIIHVDDLVAKVKKKYFKFFLQDEKNNCTEQTKDNPKLKVGAKEFFYKNRITFNFLMKLRSFLIMPELKKQLDEFKKEGKELVLIDDWVLTTHKELLPKLDHIYVMERKYLDRRQGYKQRDALTTKELKVSDIPYSLGFVKVPQADSSTTSIIYNNGSLEELEENALKIYSKYVCPTFDEKYKIKTPIQAIRETARELPKSVSKVNSLNKKIGGKEN